MAGCCRETPRGLIRLLPLASCALPSQKSAAAGPKDVCMDDALRFVGGYEHDLKQAPHTIGPDHQHPQLPVVLLLRVADRVVDGVEHVALGDPVLSRTGRDLKRHHNEYAPVRQRTVYGRSSSRNSEHRHPLPPINVELATDTARSTHAPNAQR